MNETTTIVREKVGVARWRPAGYGSAEKSRGPKENEKAIAIKLREALQELADYDDPDGIAKLLEVNAVTGDCGDSARCAASVWLQKVVGFKSIRVSYNVVAVFDDGLKAVYPTPDVVRSFYIRFDAEQYPDLIDQHHEYASW